MKKKVGLVLGSGSAKGLAHIGVIQVLLENEIPIDIVVGSSMGAVIGSVYAVGGDMYWLEKYVKAIGRTDYIDMVMPRRGGFIAGHKLEDMIRSFTHNKTFDQTNIPFACVATDVETGELIEFTRGPLHEAVRASMAIPGIFLPVRIAGRLCVDGGVLGRVPCMCAKRMGADLIIAVDVGNRGEYAKVEKYSSFSIWQNCLNIMQWEITKLSQEVSDVTICPQLPHISALSNSAAQVCIAEGRRAALKALPKIRELLS